jgi:dTDP-4-dehydrorhamnose 3,5-epimerase
VSVSPTSIDGLFVVDSPVLEDERGFFRESFRLDELSDAVGRPVSFRQNNHSRSSAGVLRGFHVEPWDKLVYVVRGLALCVVADPRPQSATFGRFESFLLGDSPGHRRRLFVARGLANAFQAMAETDYVNEVSEVFDPTDRRGFAWNDPRIGAEWPISAPILSAADRALPTLDELIKSSARQAS